ncbi:hypothetical protein [Mycoplasmopsis gallinacea]|uniref:Uncharacterized protein n=1 Tax=Mycoplasmopsis gallinacea TaxID=29556 RepID=A0A6H0V1X6_9BACT|nr:hypothetical protein [Mycoplasmopsis gallinacea]QIW61978.1 hypothetical protein GOQ20_00625 [Mycoplasmopsis gallinacea]
MTKKDVYEQINKKTKLIWNILISVFLTALSCWFIFVITKIITDGLKENETKEFAIFAVLMFFVILLWLFFAIKNVLILIFKGFYRKNNESERLKKLASIILLMMFQFNKRKFILQN